MPGHETHLTKFKTIEITQSMFSDHNGTNQTKKKLKNPLLLGNQTAHVKVAQKQKKKLIF
jgi:hypothetical protein